MVGVDGGGGRGGVFEGPRCFLSHVDTTFGVISFRCPPSNWQINRGFSLNGITVSTLYSSSVWDNDKFPALQASRALWALTMHIWVFCGIQPSSPTHLFCSEPCCMRSECFSCCCDHFTLQVSPEKFCSKRGMSLSLCEHQSPMSCHQRILFFFIQKLSTISSLVFVLLLLTISLIY